VHFCRPRKGDTIKTVEGKGRYVMKICGNCLKQDGQIKYATGLLKTGYHLITVKKQSPEGEEIKVGREALVKDMKWRGRSRCFSF
jgi:hypothetical protein